MLFNAIVIVLMVFIGFVPAFGSDDTSLIGIHQEAGPIKLFSNYRKTAFYAAIKGFPSEKDKYESDGEFISRRDRKIQELSKLRYLFPVESYSEYDVDHELMKFHIREKPVYEYPATKDEISSADSDYIRLAYFASLSGGRSAGILHQAELRRDRLISNGTLLATVTITNIKDVDIKLSRNIAKQHGENYKVAVEGRIDIAAIPDARLIATKVLIYDKKSRRVSHVALTE